MTTTTRIGLATIGLALPLGIMANGLLRVTPWGINVLLWLLLLTVCVIGVAVGLRLPLARSGGLLALAALATATGWAVRDSFTLNLVNLLALCLALGLVAVYGRSGRLLQSSVIDYGLNLIMTGISIWFGPFLVALSDIAWKSLPRTVGLRQALLFGLGLLIVLPFLVIFAGLFVAADAIFEKLVGEILRWVLTDLVVHLIVSAFAAWLVAGFVRQLFIGLGWSPTGDAGLARPTFLALGIVELTVILGLLNLLFLSFVLVQLRYLFGGAALVEVSSTLTFAEYARRGFFELVWVTALMLPLLLGLDWLQRLDDPRQRLLYRSLVATMLFLLGVIVVSALQRMSLYQAEYGLTELRLYTTAFMLWLGVVLAWFAVTVLPGHRTFFAGGALASGFAMIVALNVLNPDDLIVRTNLGRARATVEAAIGVPVGRRPEHFDANYAVSLSADAVPVMVERVETLTPAERTRVATALLQRWRSPQQVDWRTLNVSRSQAWALVAANEARLRQWAGPSR